MLDQLRLNPGSRRNRRRKGRGRGSGYGKTCGRGQKGAGARSGRKHRPWMEGGQMPLARRLPKFGFFNRFRELRQVINVRDLGRFEQGSVVDCTVLADARLVARSNVPVKVLGQGELSHALTLRVDAISDAARRKIEAAGGSVEILPTRRRARGEGAES